MRGPSKWLGGCAIAFMLAFMIGLVLLLAFASGQWPKSEARWGRVEKGMTRDQVTHLLGTPDEVDTLAKDGARVRYGIIQGRWAEWADIQRIESQAAETWRWSRLVDQDMGVVFDNNGRVIQRYVNY